MFINHLVYSFLNVQVSSCYGSSLSSRGACRSLFTKNASRSVFLLSDSSNVFSSQISLQTSVSSPVQGLRLKTTAIINIYIRSNIFLKCFQANICHTKTKSAQTFQSHKRLHIGVQAKPSKSVGVQAPRDVYTNTPVQRSYIVGLRGNWLKDQFMANNLWSYVPRCPSSDSMKY